MAQAGYTLADITATVREDKKAPGSRCDLRVAVLAGRPKALPGQGLLRRLESTVSVLVWLFLGQSSLGLCFFFFFNLFFSCNFSLFYSICSDRERKGTLEGKTMMQVNLLLT